MVVESLAFDATTAPLAAPNDTELKARITQQLQDQGFIQALSALLSMSATHSSEDGSNSAIRLEGEQMLIAKLRGMQMKFLQGLRTRLTIKHVNNNKNIKRSGESGGDERLMDTIEESLFFFNNIGAGNDKNSDNSSSNGSFVYINTSMCSPPMSPELTISICVCKLLGLSTSYAATVAVLMQCTPDSNNTSVSTVTALNNMQLGVDSYTLRERQRGLAGERLTQTDYNLLELKPLRVFRNGECIAYDVNLVQALPERGGDGSNAEATPSDSFDCLRYGRVLTQVNSGAAGPGGDTTGSRLSGGIDTGIRRIQVKIDNETTISLLSTQVSMTRILVLARITGITTNPRVLLTFFFFFFSSTCPSSLRSIPSRVPEMLICTLKEVEIVLPPNSWGEYRSCITNQPLTTLHRLLVLPETTKRCPLRVVIIVHLLVRQLISVKLSVLSKASWSERVFRLV